MDTPIIAGVLQRSRSPGKEKLFWTRHLPPVRTEKRMRSDRRSGRPDMANRQHREDLGRRLSETLDDFGI